MTHQERYMQIAGNAYTHWNDFISSTKLTLAHQNLFDKRIAINPVVLKFFKYCAQQCLGAKDAHIIVTDLSNSPSSAGSWQGNAASWLYHMGGDIPCIIIDVRFIGAKVPVFERTKISTRILLHEIGHVVQHWRTLCPLNRGLTAAANPDHEEDAWWFALAIVGFALGSMARIGRTGPPPSHCPAWPHS